MINGETLKFKVGVLTILAAFGFAGFFLNDEQPKKGAGFRFPLPAPERFEDRQLSDTPSIPGGVNSSIHEASVVSPPLLSSLLNLGEKAERLEKIMRENGITNEMALVCLLATAKHESGFNSQTIYKEKNGSVSRGVFQFNSRGLGRGVPAEKLHTKEYQVKHLVSMSAFRQWYGEVKTKNWSVETAMTELTKRIIRCAKIHYKARIKTAKTWWTNTNKK